MLFSSVIGFSYACYLKVSQRANTGFDTFYCTYFHILLSSLFLHFILRV